MMKKNKCYTNDKSKLKQNKVVMNYSVYYNKEIIRFYRLDINMRLDKVIDFLIMNGFAFTYRIHPNKFITPSTYYINVVEELDIIEGMDDLFIIKNYLEHKKIKCKIRKSTYYFKNNITYSNKLVDYIFKK